MIAAATDAPTVAAAASFSPKAGVDVAELGSVAAMDTWIKSHGVKLWADGSSSDEEDMLSRRRNAPAPVNPSTNTKTAQETAARPSAPAQPTTVSPVTADSASKTSSADKNVAWARSLASKPKPGSGLSAKGPASRTKPPVHVTAPFSDGKRGSDDHGKHDNDYSGKHGNGNSNKRNGGGTRNIDSRVNEGAEATTAWDKRRVVHSSSDYDIVTEAPSSTNARPPTMSKVVAAAAPSGSGPPARSCSGTDDHRHKATDDRTRDLKAEVRKHLVVADVVSTAGPIRSAGGDSHRNSPTPRGNKGDKSVGASSEFDIQGPEDVTIYPKNGDRKSSHGKNIGTADGGLAHQNKSQKPKDKSVPAMADTPKVNPLGISSLSRDAGRPQVSAPPSRHVVLIAASDDFDVSTPDDEGQSATAPTVDSIFRGISTSSKKQTGARMHDEYVVSAPAAVQSTSNNGQKKKK